MAEDLRHATTTFRERLATKYGEGFFDLQQGMQNPRNPSEIGWRSHGTFPTPADAQHACKGLTGLWRIVECRTIWLSKDAKAALT